MKRSRPEINDTSSKTKQRRLDLGSVLWSNARPHNEIREIREYLKRYISEPSQCTRSDPNSFYGCRKTSLEMAYFLMANGNTFNYSKYNKIRNYLTYELSTGKQQTGKKYIYDSTNWTPINNNIYIIVTNRLWYGFKSPYHTFVLKIINKEKGEIYQSWYDGTESIDINKKTIDISSLQNCLLGYSKCTNEFTPPPGAEIQDVSSALIIDYTSLYNNVDQLYLSGGRSKKTRKKKYIKSRKKRHKKKIRSRKRHRKYSKRL